MAFGHLLLTCSLMFIGPAIFGGIPLYMGADTNQSYVNWMDSFGAGVMIGSAFAVILPEGFETLYKVDSESEDPEHGLHLLDETEHHAHGHADHQSRAASAGLALLAGFFLMLTFEFWTHKGLPGIHSHGGCSNMQGVACRNTRKTVLPVLIGLLLHAAADGLAVGVAHVSPSLKLAVTVGMAMVLHKAPVSFGLGTYLVGQRLPAETVMMDILLFAASSPLVALISYAALSSLPFFQASSFVALAVLFSAGTFLYAACVHMLPSVEDKSFTIWHLGSVIIGGAVPCFISSINMHHH